MERNPNTDLTRIKVYLQKKFPIIFFCITQIKLIGSAPNIYELYVI